MFATLKAYKWLIIAGLWAVSLGAVGWQSWRLSADHQIAGQAKQEALIAAVSAAAQASAAEAIAKIRPVHQTIQTKLQETIRENTVYRECVTDPVTVGLLDSARANQAPRPEPTGSGLVP